MRRFASIIAAACLLLVTAPCFSEIIFTANMNNASEFPATVPTLVGGGPRPASFGTATFVLNDAMTAMTMTEQSTDIWAQSTQAVTGPFGVLTDAPHSDLTGDSPWSGIIL